MTSQNANLLTRAELRALDSRVRDLPRDQADAVIERAVASPTWARRAGLTRLPVDTGTDAEAAAS